MWKQLFIGACIGTACAFLQPNQPESLIATILLCLASTLNSDD